METVDPEVLKHFKSTICDYYKAHGRNLPWRKTHDPYKILVSEIMLQQTQVGRVLDKYERFLNRFPTFHALAIASLQEILSIWRGLGYNRRAVALNKTAHIVVQQFDGKLPSDEQTLQELPGVGKTTAGTIRAFAFNEPAVFIETNIRTVFLYMFFKDKQRTKDSEIYPLVELTLDRGNPREWYYALMDYGVMLKKTCGNPSRMSAHHKKQATFQGSNRQLRGAIVALILERPGITETELINSLHEKKGTIEQNLTKLEQEGFFRRQGDAFFID